MRAFALYGCEADVLMHVSDAKTARRIATDPTNPVTRIKEVVL